MIAGLLQAIAVILQQLGAVAGRCNAWAALKREVILKVFLKITPIVIISGNEKLLPGLNIWN